MYSRGLCHNLGVIRWFINTEQLLLLCVGVSVGEFSLISLLVCFFFSAYQGVIFFSPSTARDVVLLSA